MNWRGTSLPGVFPIADALSGSVIAGMGLATAVVVAASAVVGPHPADTTSATTPVAVKTPVAKKVVAPQWGVYSDSGMRGSGQALQFGTLTGARITRVLDFAGGATWRDISQADWVFKAHANKGYTLEVSIPMLPRQQRASLAQCARGDYNHYWRAVGQRALKYGHRNASIRPGWEFNGDWYPWSAVGKAREYRGCFRQVVTTMRALPGQRFSFVWNPNVSDQKMAAETAYPGDAYVSYVSVDIYDYSWINYFNNAPSDAQRRKEWDRRLNGSRGLKFWSAFAKAHRKPLGFSEWGLAWRKDGHGGGDNAVFLNSMMAFITDPANRVAYATYFNNPNRHDLRHRIAGPGQGFPRSALRFKGWVAKAR